jgi:redox-sensitive bicupin YhaK (pirin superfamily)
MFPLLDREKPNPVELFQIWLNLPAADKLVAPHFSMLWDRDIPRCRFTDEHGRATEVTVVAGSLEGQRAPAPPPRSWASRPEADVAIWTVKMQPGAVWTLPPSANEESLRGLYFFRGPSLRVEGTELAARTAAVLHPQGGAKLEAGEGECEVLLLRGRPIGEPVAQHGPFVMNTRAEIQKAFQDYQRTRFGGWPWPKDDPVHPREEGRFAKHADGRIERV